MYSFLKTSEILSMIIQYQKSDYKDKAIRLIQQIRANSNNQSTHLLDDPELDSNHFPKISKLIFDTSIDMKILNNLENIIKTSKSLKELQEYKEEFLTLSIKSNREFGGMIENELDEKLKPIKMKIDQNHLIPNPSYENLNSLKHNQDSKSSSNTVWIAAETIGVLTIVGLIIYLNFKNNS